MVAFGVLLVAVDFRIVAVDVIPDAAGWLLVAAGAWKLALRGPVGLALVAAAASAADVYAPHHYDAIDPITGKVVPHPAPGTSYHERLVFDRLTDVRLVLALVAVVAGGAALWWVLSTMAARARVLNDGQSASRLDALRWLVVGVWVVPYVVVALVQTVNDGGLDPVWNGGLELLALLGLVVAAGVAWMLATNSNRMWTATDAERTTPWADLFAPGQ